MTDFSSEKMREILNSYSLSVDGGGEWERGSIIEESPENHKHVIRPGQEFNSPGNAERYRVKQVETKRSQDYVVSDELERELRMISWRRRRIENVVKTRVKGLKRRQKYIVCTDEARANKHMLEKSRYAASKTADMLQEYKRLIKQLKKEYKSEVKADSTKEELTRTTNKLKNVTAALKASDLKLALRELQIEAIGLREKLKCSKERRDELHEKFTVFCEREVASVKRWKDEQLTAVYKIYKNKEREDHIRKKYENFSMDFCGTEESLKLTIASDIDESEDDLDIEARLSLLMNRLPDCVDTIDVDRRRVLEEAKERTIYLEQATFLEKRHAHDRIVAEMMKEEGRIQLKYDDCLSKFVSTHRELELTTHPKKPPRRTAPDIFLYTIPSKHALGLEKVRLAEPYKIAVQQHEEAVEAASFNKKVRQARSRMIRDLERAEKEVKRINVASNIAMENAIRDAPDKTVFKRTVDCMGDGADTDDIFEFQQLSVPQKLLDAAKSLAWAKPS